MYYTETKTLEVVLNNLLIYHSNKTKKPHENPKYVAAE